MKNIELTGLKELRAKLRKLEGAGADKVLKSVSRKALTPYVQRAKQNAPVDQGDLKRSIGKETEKGKFRERGAMIAGPRRKKGNKNAQGFHAIFAEFGTAPRFENGKLIRGLPATRFLTKAWHSTKGEVLKVYRERLREEIKRRSK